MELNNKYARYTVLCICKQRFRFQTIKIFDYVYTVRYQYWYHILHLNS
jgi:hypothetical protein